VLITFSFTRLAVQVRRWFEIGADATGWSSGPEPARRA
jgi:hypothetical protein